MNQRLLEIYVRIWPEHWIVVLCDLVLRAIIFSTLLALLWNFARWAGRSRR